MAAVAEKNGKVVLKAKRNEIDYAIKTEAWLKQVAETFTPLVRKERNRARVFEPTYTIG
jgi:hypothetical protein